MVNIKIQKEIILKDNYLMDNEDKERIIIIQQEIAKDGK